MQETYYEAERELDIAGQYDVIVAGSGPSGIAAAVAAGRLGMRVLLIESLGTVGGMSTSGMMSHWTGGVRSELYDELLHRAAQRNPYETGKVKIEIDPELLKITYYEMLREAGVTVLLYTLVCGVMREGQRICGVITENKSGRRAYAAEVVVDATGDGDVACRAGAAYYKGREEDGRMQPATLMFKVGGVDESAPGAVFPCSFETNPEVPGGRAQDLAREKLTPPLGHVLLYRSTIPGVVTCNMTNLPDIDGTKAEDLSRAEQVCRAQMEPLVTFLRACMPGFAHCYIVSAASLIGIRETRHFLGVYQLTEEDILTARQFPDWVVRDAYFNFDVHNLRGAGLDETGVQAKFGQKNGYTIPYGALIPEKLDGLLLCGRNISGTHMAHSNFRAMPICFGIGEAAGTAAALACRNGCAPRSVVPSEIQQCLCRAGGESGSCAAD